MADKIRELLEERGEEYGEAWLLVGKYISVLWMNPLVAFDAIIKANLFHNWVMIQSKLFRMLKSPRKVDHWKDLIGYAQLIVDYLEE